MANINRIFPQVGLQGGPTDIPQTGATPVADAIGQVADVGSQFAQRYQQAKYARGQMDTMLEVKKQVNSYHENLRTNPITQDDPSDDIVQMKEDDWNKFASESIDRDLLGQIKDPRLREDMANWWSSESENQRSNLVNAAIDENVTFMSARTMEDIQTAIANEQYPFALALGQSGVENGLLSREMYDEVQDSVALQRVLSVAEGLDIEDAERFIATSPLEEDKKALANRWMKERKLIQASEMEAAYENWDNATYSDLFIAVASGQLKGSENLTKALADIGTATYNGEPMEGSDDAFRAAHSEKLFDTMNQLARANKKAGDEGGFTLDRVAYGNLEDIMLSGNRDELLSYLWDLAQEGRIDSTTIQDYIERANKSKINSKLLDDYADTFDQKMKAVIADGTIDVGDEATVRHRWNQTVEAYSDEQEFKEKYHDDMNNFFENLGADALSAKITELGQTIRKPGDMFQQDTQEDFLESGRMGKFVGLVSSTALNNYLNSPSPDLDKLKEETAQYLYNQSYDSIKSDKKKKAKVEFSEAVAEYAGAIQRASTEIGEGGITMIDPQGVPYVEFPNTDPDEDPISYRLEMVGKEEEWFVHGQDTITGEEGWYPAGIPHAVIEGASAESFLNTLGLTTEKTEEQLETLTETILTEPGSPFVEAEADSDEVWEAAKTAVSDNILSEGEFASAWGITINEARDLFKRARGRNPFERN